MLSIILIALQLKLIKCTYGWSVLLLSIRLIALQLKLIKCTYGWSVLLLSIRLIALQLKLIKCTYGWSVLLLNIKINSTAIEIDKMFLNLNIGLIASQMYLYLYLISFDVLTDIIIAVIIFGPVYFGSVSVWSWFLFLFRSLQFDFCSDPIQ